MGENTTLKGNNGSKIWTGILKSYFRIKTLSHLNVIGNQTAIPCDCDGKVVIAAGRLAGHEIQLKNATKSQEKDASNVGRGLKILPSVNHN